MTNTNRRHQSGFSDDEREVSTTLYSSRFVRANHSQDKSNNLQHSAGKDSSQHIQFSSDSVLSNSTLFSGQGYNLPPQNFPLLEAAHPNPRQTLQPKSRIGQHSGFARNSNARIAQETSSSRNIGVPSSPRDMNGVSLSHNGSFDTVPSVPMTSPQAHTLTPQLGLSSSASLAQPTITISKAHMMKAQLGPSVNIPLVATRKRILPEHDPENYEIKRLRCEEKMSWGEIAQNMNDLRVATGKAPTFTEAAVYGRFVRNGPRIAQVTGEEFSPKDYVNVRKPRNTGVQQSLAGSNNFTPLQDEYLVEAYAEAQAAFWATVAEGLYNRSGKQYSMAECATRYNQL
jgi:hypothetical protein